MTYMRLPYYLNPCDPTYTWPARWERAKDDLCLWLAHRLPRRLRRWVVVDSFARASTANPQMIVDDLGYREVSEAVG